MQVELDAPAPDDLRRLYAAAISDYWERDAFASSLERERLDGVRLVLPDLSGETRAA
jgi:hypothetical protein